MGASDYKSRQLCDPHNLTSQREANNRLLGASASVFSCSPSLGNAGGGVNGATKLPVHSSSSSSVPPSDHNDDNVLPLDAMDDDEEGSSSSSAATTSATTAAASSALWSARPVGLVSSRSLQRTATCSAQAQEEEEEADLSFCGGGAIERVVLEDSSPMHIAALRLVVRYCYCGKIPSESHNAFHALVCAPCVHALCMRVRSAYACVRVLYVRSSVASRAFQSCSSAYPHLSLHPLSPSPPPRGVRARVRACVSCLVCV